METIALLARGVALGCILLLGIRTWLEYRKLVAARMLLLFCGGLAAYLIVPAVETWRWLSFSVILAAISVPASFWLFCDSLFNDWDSHARKVGFLRWGFIILFLGLSLLVYWMSEQGGVSMPVAGWQLSYLPMFYLSYAIRVGFLLFAILAVVAQWKNDLVESRRLLRRWVIVISSLYILLVILVELMLRGDVAPPILEFANSVTLALLLLTVSVWYLIVNPHDLFEYPATQTNLNSSVLDTEVDVDLNISRGIDNSGLSHTERNWLQDLNTHMRQEHGYRQPKLSITKLAELVSIPEHILRRLINQHLGFRNFNDFLNQFRLAEAASRLSDPEEERIPILTIALDSGFASITPFNRAFKAHFQSTPSEYRRRQLAE